MVTDADYVAPTRESLVEEANHKASLVRAAEKAHATAMKQFESSVGKVSMEELLDFGRTVDKAKADVENAARLAKRAQERVDGFELEAKRDERNSLIASDVKDTTEATDFDAYIAVGVEKLILTIDMVEKTVSPKASGPGVRTSTPRASSNGSGGFKSRGAVIVQDVEYPSLGKAYTTLRAAKDGEEHLTKPYNGVTARGWLTKNAGGFRYVDPTVTA